MSLALTDVTGVGAEYPSRTTRVEVTVTVSMVVVSFCCACAGQRPVARTRTLAAPRKRPRLLHCSALVRTRPSRITFPSRLGPDQTAHPILAIACKAV